MSTGPDVKATVGDISSDGNLNVAQEECSRKGFCSVRHGLALILQLCNFSIYTQQMNLSIAIPAMVNNTAPPSQPNASTERPSTDSQGYWNETLKEFKAMSGILSALPFVVGCICIILGGLLADFLLSRKILRLITIRKLFTAIGVLFPSVILVSLPWVRSSHSMTMTFLVLSSAISSFCESGALVNFLDIAPRYTGFLKGLLQVFAHIAGAISPTAAGFFISQDSEFGWRNVFLLSAAVNISGLVFYLIFGRADVQDWAKEQTFTHL
ncbi:putative small intestine urate exporter isoform X9 [Homo sapiens]|uniref:Isoform 3 of Probable small intestine urate exporter n=1 Tax=Homo sapiens TaxID=9606 RepID=Q9Y2C5-3|nr:probable small intestine urate exporter isoform X9 [Homo sapiens]XP_047273996.1 probable small intestine urate exporter isoform X9 [Homo sapiens]XP_054209963.1 probable small intestine urate exporter isoform X9 [Homo sapiens]|eukprot:XP_011512521.1 probable small intestine urate exporter isoform X9 [Homo sapiens]